MCRYQSRSRWPENAQAWAAHGALTARKPGGAAIAEPQARVPLLAIRGLSKSYGPVRAVDNLSLEVRSGEIYGLVGPNGAGKSTTLRVVLGFLRPDRGHVEVFGCRVSPDSWALRGRIGYLPGEIRLEGRPTGGETLDFLGGFHRNLDQDYRRSLVARFALDLDKRVAEYSKGNRQKLALIAALQHRPELLLLDEPSAGLDPVMQQELYRALAERAAEGAAVLFSSHVLSEVQAVCQRVGVLRAGRLVFEKPVASLVRESGRRVEVLFHGPPPEEAALRVPGMREVERRGERLRLFYDGDADRLVKLLAGFAVADLIVERANLEDLFLKHYSEQEPGSREAQP